MSRIRISTTVDESRLHACRRLLEKPDSELVDRALKALLNELESEIEIRALEAHPYDADADLAWTVSETPALPYDGAVPKEVVALARKKRRRT